MDRLTRLDSDTSWAVTQVEITDEGHEIASAIREGKCISVSDGSFKSKQHGTASVRAITSRQEHLRIKARIAAKCQDSWVKLPWSARSVRITTSQPELSTLGVTASLL
jgi:hypothetical protein